MTAAPLVQQPALGELIEQRREALGLTKSEAARLAGVSRGTWHEVEAGKRTNMLAGTLNLFDRALGYERGTLRRLSRSDPRTPPNEAAPQTPVFVSHTTEDAERLQLLRYVMTMSSDNVRTILLMVSADDAVRQRLQTIDLVRAITLEQLGEPSRDDDNSGRTDAKGTRRTDSRARSTKQAAG